MEVNMIIKFSSPKAYNIATNAKLHTNKGVKGAKVDPILPNEEQTANSDCLAFVGNTSDT